MVTFIEEYRDWYDYDYSVYRLAVKNGEEEPFGYIRLQDLDDCPEDATIRRGLDISYGIKELIKVAYEAGKRGDEIKFETFEEDKEQDEYI